jgi:SAM-dependent methyltransferase
VICRVEDSSFWDNVLSKEALAWGDSPSSAVGCLTSHLPAPARVLIPGCGYGRNALGLARLGYQVVAADTSRPGLERARVAFAHPAITYVEQSVFDVRGEPYDAILAHYVIHLFDAAARVRLMTVWRNALRPGGLLVVTALSTRCSFFGQGQELEPGTWSNPGWLPIHFETASTLTSELEGCGFSVVHAEEGLEPEMKPAGDVNTPTIYALARVAGRSAVRGSSGAEGLSPCHEPNGM